MLDAAVVALDIGILLWLSGLDMPDPLSTPIKIYIYSGCVGDFSPCCYSRECKSAHRVDVRASLNVNVCARLPAMTPAKIYSVNASKGGSSRS
jgi:hypothetical protein